MNDLTVGAKEIIARVRELEEKNLKLALLAGKSVEGDLERYLRLYPDAPYLGRLLEQDVRIKELEAIVNEYEQANQDLKNKVMELSAENVVLSEKLGKAMAAISELNGTSL